MRATPGYSGTSLAKKLGIKKVCAVTAVWSGLKLVIRKSERTAVRSTR